MFHDSWRLGERQQKSTWLYELGRAIAVSQYEASGYAPRCIYPDPWAKPTHPGRLEPNATEPYQERVDRYPARL